MPSAPTLACPSMQGGFSAGRVQRSGIRRLDRLVSGSICGISTGWAQRSGIHRAQADPEGRPRGSDCFPRFGPLLALGGSDRFHLARSQNPSRQATGLPALAIPPAGAGGSDRFHLARSQNPSRQATGLPALAIPPAGAGGSDRFSAQGGGRCAPSNTDTAPPNSDTAPPTQTLHPKLRDCTPNSETAPPTQRLHAQLRDCAPDSETALPTHRLHTQHSAATHNTHPGTSTHNTHPGTSRPLGRRPQRLKSSPYYRT